MTIDPQDHADITNLIAAYGLAIHDGEVEDWADTFTADGRFEGSLGEATGRDELVTFLQGMKDSIAGNTRDYTSNTVLRREVDEIVETSYVMTARKDAAPIMIATGMYFGRLTKTDAGWRFAYRRLDIDPNYQG